MQRYVDAWQAADVGKLVDLLRQDVVMTMPPLPLRYSSRSNVIQFLTSIPTLSERQQFRYVATRANRQPAMGVYRRGAGQGFVAWAPMVLTADGDSVAEMTVFIDPSLMPVFGLPMELPPADA